MGGVVAVERQLDVRFTQDRVPVLVLRRLT